MADAPLSRHYSHNFIVVLRTGGRTRVAGARQARRSERAEINNCFRMKI
jgi:hypothetical protein